MFWGEIGSFSLPSLCEGFAEQLHQPRRDGPTSARAKHQLVGVLSARVTAGHRGGTLPWLPASSLPRSSCHRSPRVLPLFPFSAPNFPALENPPWRSGRGCALPVSGREVLHSASGEGAGVAGTGGEQQWRQLAKRRHGAVLQAPGELFVKRCCCLRCLPGGAGPRTRLRFPHSSCCLCKPRVCFCRAGGGKTRSESAAVPGWCQQLWRGARGWQQAAASGSVWGWSCCTPGTAWLG